MFVDEVKIFARAGHGGRGCVAFLRETFRPKGGPSGGNGGRGGDVILEADHDLNNLVNQYFQPRLIAQKGENGMGKGMDGHAGADLVVKVPCGTLVWRLSPSSDCPAEPPESARLAAESPAQVRPALPASLSSRPILRHAAGGSALEVDLASESRVEGRGSKVEGRGGDGTNEGEQVADLTGHGQRFVLCHGGRGGLGNRNFATSRRQAPRFAQPGEPGDEGAFLLELRLMADVGLVGYPNAGKSTLLAAISKARPRIAPYPFTTLRPQMGIVEYPGWQRLHVCDVPGLIEGAHRNVGLGHAFLRHIQRCQVLVLLLDMSGNEGRAPWDDYRQLLRELELYDEALLSRPRLVVANKMDEPASESNLRSFRRRVPKTRVLRMAAAFDQGISEFKHAIRRVVEAVAVSAGRGSRE